MEVGRSPPSPRQNKQDMGDNGTVQVYKLLESEKLIVLECKLVGLWVTTRVNSYKSSSSL